MSPFGMQLDDNTSTFPESNGTADWTLKNQQHQWLDENKHLSSGVVEVLWLN
jgi:hypothetical protein